MKRSIVAILISLLMPGAMASGQVTTHGDSGSWRVDSLRWRGELNMQFSGGKQTPFWLVSNTQGLGSLKKNNGYLRASIYKDMDRNNRFSWGAGVDLVGGVRQQSPFSIHQLYGELRYRCLDLLIGQKELTGVMSNPRLSSGNLLYSGNAVPIPQIRAGIFDYASIWGTKGWLGIKGYIAFGMFSDSKWAEEWVKNGSGAFAKNVLYHSKGLWLRNGNSDKFPLIFEAGIEMATQFGGDIYYYKTPGNLVHYKAPSGVKAWWKALLPLGGGNDTPQSEQANVQGNFLGNWTFALSWNPKADWNIKAYYQHMFEDHSMLYIEYPWRDGLIGVEATLPKNRFVSKVAYEFIHLKDQTSPVYWDYTDRIPEQVSGRDEYYFHYMYQSWQHWGEIIGNPMVISPVYNNGSLLLRSSRLIGHHLGFEGEPSDEISYRILASYSRNWGTYKYPLPDVADNFNFLAEVKWSPKRLKGWEGSFSLAADGGDLLGRSVGVGISISKTGLIKF